MMQCSGQNANTPRYGSANRQRPFLWDHLKMPGWQAVVVKGKVTTRSAQKEFRSGKKPQEIK